MSEWVDAEKRPFGWFSEDEGTLYRETVSRYPSGVLVELGVYLGRSLSYVLQTCRDLGVEVFAVDTWDRENPIVDKHQYYPPRRVELFQANLRRLGFERDVCILESDSIQAAAKFRNESVSVIMLDTLHTRERTLQEIGAWLPKLKRGGSFLFHDYNAERRHDPTRGSFVLEAVEAKFGTPNRVVHGLALVKKEA